ncbi:4351_t:CDS:1, partial [Scutellospora calospora]
CNWYIRKHSTLGAAQVKPEYVTSNRANLCRNYLLKCSNFKEYATPKQVEHILSLP